MLLFLAALAALGVVCLADAAREHDGLSRVDPVAAADMLRLRTSGLTHVARALTIMGSEVMVGGLSLIVIVMLLARRKLPEAATFAVGIGGSAFLTVAVKLLVGRSRPGQADRLGAVDTTFSFPSGHTLNSAVFLALVVLLLWPALNNVMRGALVVAAGAWAVGVGASRVYLGYHWLTDVAASVLLAVAWVSVVWAMRGLIVRAVASARARLVRSGFAVRLWSGRPLDTQGMTSTEQLATRTRQMLNKVPEVTVYFWIIKILCTTVGESFADYINETLGFGLTNTTLVFSIALIAALVVQFRLDRYVPGVYWLAVVLISVVGTLLTDNLTDARGVPLWLSTTVFSVLLAAVFGIWYARERTLSIHTIVTTPRESFYWLTVLVTFALGTAAGDWTLELTGWSPGAAVMLPLGLILAVLIAWRVGAGPVLSFWLAYILTRPLGANIGDYLASPRADGGLGLGTFGTSLLFLGTILLVVIYLTKTQKNRTELVPHASASGERI